MATHNLSNLVEKKYYILLSWVLEKVSTIYIVGYEGPVLIFELVARDKWAAMLRLRGPRF